MLKNKKKFFSILIIFIIIIIFMIFKNIFAKNSDAIQYEKIEVNSGENIYTYKDYIYIYGKSGIKIYQNTDLIYEEAFDMENPYMVSSYDKIVIGDFSGKTIRIFNSSSLLYYVNHSESILSCTVNKNGYSAIISKTDSLYEILVFNNKGENIFYLSDITSSEGIPVNLALSNDNLSLAVSFLNIESSYIESNIAIYSLSQDENTDSLIAAFKKSNQMSAIIKFVDYQNLVILSDKELSIISVKESSNSVKELSNIEFKNTIDFVRFLNTSYFALIYGTALEGQDKSAVNQNSAILYNALGGKVKEISFDKDITGIYANAYGFVVAQNRFFEGYSTSGTKVFEYQATQDIKDVQFFGSTDRLLILTENEIKILKLSKKTINLLEEISEEETEETSEDADVTEEISEDVDITEEIEEDALEDTTE